MTRAVAWLGMLVLAAGVVRAEPLAVGATLPPLVGEDQHGAPAKVDDSVRLLLVSHDMDGGDVVKAALATANQEFLDRHHAVYVADIAGMPAMISKLFALPKMRQRPYRIVLDRDGSSTRDLPREKGHVTVVALDRLRITRIEQVASADALRATLDQAPLDG
jgi:hypothetical protein